MIYRTDKRLQTNRILVFLVIIALVLGLAIGCLLGFNIGRQSLAISEMDENSTLAQETSFTVNSTSLRKGQTLLIEFTTQVTQNTEVSIHLPEYQAFITDRKINLAYSQGISESISFKLNQALVWSSSCSKCFPQMEIKTGLDAETRIEHKIVWNLTDSTGREAPPQTYYIYGIAYNRIVPLEAIEISISV
jgi:hypothetical protein